MVTKEQAVAASLGDQFHEDGCAKIIGPRGGVTYKCYSHRVTGKCQTWKTQPERFYLPVKYGLRGYGRITENNANQMHRAEDCPVLELRGF